MAQKSTEECLQQKRFVICQSRNSMHDDLIADLVEMGLLDMRLSQGALVPIPDGLLSNAFMPRAGLGHPVSPASMLPKLSGVRKYLNLHRGKDDSLDLQIRPTMSGGKPGLKYIGVNYRKILD